MHPMEKFLAKNLEKEEGYLRARQAMESNRPVLENNKYLATAEKYVLCSMRDCLETKKRGESNKSIRHLAHAWGEVNSVYHWDLPEAARRPKSFESTAREKR
jgi:MarR-like DNA-binding transcriptional regulator SgrR of sgrS sRNA